MVCGITGVALDLEATSFRMLGVAVAMNAIRGVLGRTRARIPASSVSAVRNPYSYKFELCRFIQHTLLALRIKVKYLIKSL